MGEYTGRRRGRAASEPPAQEPGYSYVEESSYQQGYFAEEYAQPEQQQYGYEYAPEYTQDPAYGYQESPAYEQYPGHGQYPSYEQQPPPSYEQYPSYEQQQQPSYEQQQPSSEPAPYYDYGTNEQQSYPQQGYADEYQAEYYYQEDYQQESYQEPYQEYYPEQPYEEQPYQEQPYQEQPYQEQPYQEQPYQEQPYGEQPYYEQPYEEQQPAPRRRSASAEESYPGEYSSYDSYGANTPYEYEPSPEPLRPPLPLMSHLPYAGAATAALAIASFVSAKAVAAVVMPLQLVVAWAVLDLAGFRSRRTAAMAALPALAGVLGTFEFQPDDAVLPIAAGLGAGFVLIAADAVFRTRRRGVEPGTSRALAAAASALLFAGLTGLFLPAAVLDSTSVAIGAAVCGVASVSAARNRELGVSRTAVVAIPVTIAALASYAAAILVP